MKHKQCGRTTVHRCHDWFEEVPNSLDPARRLCEGVPDPTPEPAPEYEPGGYERKRCEDTRPHRCHTWFNDVIKVSVYTPARTALCEGVPSAVVHNPDANCDCQPDGSNRCEYRMLADAVVEHLPTRDGDEAEVALCVQAVQRVGDALRVFRTGPGDL